MCRLIMTEPPGPSPWSAPTAASFGGRQTLDRPATRPFSPCDFRPVPRARSRARTRPGTCRLTEGWGTMGTGGAGVQSAVPEPESNSAGPGN